MRKKTFYAFILLVIVSIGVFAIKYYSLEHMQKKQPQLKTIAKKPIVKKIISPKVKNQNAEVLREGFTNYRNTFIKLTNKNERALEAFDLFAANLIISYKRGEGIIHQDLNRIVEALIFATEKYKGQWRKQRERTPYISHTLEVANNLFVIGSIRDPDIIIAALLHDIIEDYVPFEENGDVKEFQTKVAQFTEELKEKFGDRIVNFILEITLDISLRPEERKKTSLENASKMSAGAAEIQLADKIANLTDIMKTPPENWGEDQKRSYFKYAENITSKLPWVNKNLTERVEEVIFHFKEENEAIR